MDVDSPEKTTVMTVSPAAAEMVMTALAEEPDAANLGLWVEVAGISQGHYTYDLYFQAVSDADSSDVIEQLEDNLALVIPRSSVDKLRGARLDVSGSGEEAGMVIINPNTPLNSDVSGLKELLDVGDLDNDLAHRVQAVLDERVNPAIAAHGGYASLVGVRETTVYLQLEGGCQGCGLARMTLSQGIEVAIKEAVPDIEEVVDVTDHARGTHPYA
ncbi:MAG: NifU family protein [Actinobacteria bacterium]|jgi:Fe/S biogenesis protein NfuA|nr:NifU family protein [Actinomycetota bacterium]MCL6094473.1 NifU family protein [Actinomycetota bacterium]